MPHKPTIILVTGGARSGKSHFAIEKADSLPGGKVYLATGEALDAEMRQRILQHKQRRPPHWATIEEPINICAALHEAEVNYQVVLLDCMTLWISNLLTRVSLSEEGVKGRIEELALLLPSLRCSLVAVTNEVGMGVVPENPLARSFRDLAGFANQKLSEASSQAYFMVSGLPVRLK